MVFRKLLDGLKSTGVVNRISPTGVGTICFFVVISKTIVTLAQPPLLPWAAMIDDDDDDGL